MLKNSLFQPSLSFSFSAAPFFLFLLQRTFFFFSSFLVSAVSSLFSTSFFLFFLTCCPFFSAQNTCIAQNVFSPRTFSAQNVFQFSPTHFFFSFLFCFQRTFFISVQRLLLLLLFSAPFSCL